MEDREVRRMLNAARAVCRRKGYPVDDPDYGSAIGFGVFKSVLDHKDGKGQTVESYACLFALRECENTRRVKDRDARCDQAGASRGIGAPPVDTPIPLTDFEILSFVAARGKSSATRLLFGNCGGTAYKKLCTLLDEIALRVRAEPWRVQEEWIGGDDYDSHDPNGGDCSFSASEEAPLGTRGVRWRRAKFRDNGGDGDR